MVEGLMMTIPLVDNQPTIHSGLRMRLELEPDLAITGEAGDGATALALTCATHAQIVVMAIAMPIMDGITATAALRIAVPESAVVVHSLHDNATRRPAPMRQGRSRSSANTASSPPPRRHPPSRQPTRSPRP